MEFTEFERKVIEFFLSWPVEGTDILRTQYETATVIGRDWTEMGFDTEISVDRSLAPVPCSVKLERVLSSGVLGIVKSAPSQLIMFELSVDAGYFVWLSGTTSDRHWPDEREIVLSRSVMVPARRGKWPWSKREAGPRPGGN